MANLAVRSFTTLGYIGAALLIAVVALLALTSLGSDSSGQQATATATPAPSSSRVGPNGDAGTVSEGIEAAGAGGIVDVHEGVRGSSRHANRSEPRGDRQRDFRLPFDA